MKRVLMTCDAVGGVWTYTVELARALGQHGVETFIAAMGPAPSGAQRAELAEIPTAAFAHAPFALEWMDEPWSDVDAAGEWLLDLARNLEPDVVHLNGFAHAAIAWPAPALIVAHSCVLTWWRAVHDSAAPDCYAEYRRRVRAGLEAAVHVITPTRAFRSSFEDEHGMRLRGTTIHNARTPALFFRREKEAAIFSAGRVWDEAKNIALLQRIAPRVAWPIYAAGDRRIGSAREGRLSPREVAEQLSRAAIYAAPARYEPFGLSILEAALSGCALVLSDLPTLRELWDVCAVFLPPDDDDAWCGALDDLAHDASVREQLAAAAHERARRFTPAAQAGAYLEAYRQIGSGSPAHLLAT